MQVSVRVGEALEPFQPEIQYAVTALLPGSATTVDVAPGGNPFPLGAARLWYGPRGHPREGDADVSVADGGLFRREGFLRSTPLCVSRTRRDHAPPEIAAAFAEADFISLFGDASSMAGSDPASRGVRHLPWDIIAATFYLLTGYEDCVKPASARDEHGRTAVTARVAGAHQFEDRPLVDEYRWLLAKLGGWPLAPGEGAGVHMTVDVDHLPSTGPVGRTLRTIAGDIAKRRAWRVAARRANSECWRLLRRAPAADLAGIFALADFGGPRRPRRTFHFKASARGPFDSGYPIAHPVIARTVALLREDGCEIGFHPGYDTMGQDDLWRAEFRTLKTALGEPLCGGRQHYLRAEYPETWRLIEDSGLAWSSNRAFTHTAGFAAGTAGAYQPWDLWRRRAMNLLERPLLFMDATYRNRPTEVADTLELLYGRSARYGHPMTVLFHNTPLIDPLRVDPYAASKLEWLRLLEPRA